jgi:hypothetical protein
MKSTPQWNFKNTALSLSTRGLGGGLKNPFLKIPELNCLTGYPEKQSRATPAGNPAGTGNTINYQGGKGVFEIGYI